VIIGLHYIETEFSLCTLFATSESSKSETSYSIQIWIGVSSTLRSLYNSDKNIVSIEIEILGVPFLPRGHYRMQWTPTPQSLSCSM